MTGRVDRARWAVGSAADPIHAGATAEAPIHADLMVVVFRDREGGDRTVMAERTATRGMAVKAEVEVADLVAGARSADSGGT